MSSNGPYFQKSISYSFFMDLNVVFYNMHIKNNLVKGFCSHNFIISLTTFDPHLNDDITIYYNFNTTK
jgi:spore coat protein CotF